MNKELGIVLSGGGVRGVAHIGLLQALKENGIRPQIIAGASAGALVGALYAADYSTKEMLNFFKTTPLFKFSFYAVKKPGIMDSERYRIFLEKYFPVDSFAVLNTPLYVTTTDLAKGEVRIFNEGQLFKPLLASAALPPLFCPVKINGRLYADGGIMDNFPVQAIKSKCDIVIGSYVNPVGQYDHSYFNSSTRVLLRSDQLRSYANAKSQFHMFNYVFAPKALRDIGLFDVKRLKDIYLIGYETAHAEMDNIKAALHMKDKRELLFDDTQMLHAFSLN